MAFETPTMSVWNRVAAHTVVSSVYSIYSVCAWCMTFRRMSYDPQKTNHQLTQFTSIIDWFGLCNRSFRFYRFCCFFRNAFHHLILFLFFAARAFHTCVRFASQWRQFNWFKGERNERVQNDWIKDRETRSKTNNQRILMCPYHEPSCLNYIKFTKFLYEFLDWLNFIKCFTVLTETNFDVVLPSRQPFFSFSLAIIPHTYILPLTFPSHSISFLFRNENILR